MPEPRCLFLAAYSSYPTFHPEDILTPPIDKYAEEIVFFDADPHHYLPIIVKGRITWVPEKGWYYVKVLEQRIDGPGGANIWKEPIFKDLKDRMFEIARHSIYGESSFYAVIV